MAARTLINPPCREFFCWRWHRWVGWRKLNYCYGRSCRGMEAPPQLRWKARLLGGLLVPASSPGPSA